MRKLHVRLFRESLVRLVVCADLIQIKRCKRLVVCVREQFIGQLREIIDEADSMRIAHGNAGESERTPRRGDGNVLCKRRTVGAGSIRGNVNGDIAGLKNGMAHIDRSARHLVAIVNLEADGFRAGKRVGNKLAVACLNVSAINEVFCEATHAIAAHLGQRAIGIDVMHVSRAFAAL